jgi:hypothetical protein
MLARSAPGVVREQAETDAAIKAHGSMGVYEAPKGVDALCPHDRMPTAEPTVD